MVLEFLKRFFSYTIVPLLLISIMPNFVLVLWYIVSQCDGSFMQFYDKILTVQPKEFLLAMWRPAFSWESKAHVFILGYSLWAGLLQVIVPGPRLEGPLTAKGNTPVYKDNGFSCYVITMVAFGGLTYVMKTKYGMTPTIVFDHYGEVLAWLSLYSLFICVLLYLKGWLAPSTSDNGSSGNFIFDYYWGTELYPRVFGIDIKVFTNCRFGLTIWALVISICFLKSYELYGFVDSMFVCWLLQMIYLTKFFWWEGGYMRTMDISVDRAGFYICWGCLVYVPGFYTLCSLYMVAHPVKLGIELTAFFIVAGAASIFINYQADYQRQVFRETGGKCLIWGKKPDMIWAKYRTEAGQDKLNPLLLSGWWGVARHFHYLPELALSFFWSVPALFDHLLPFSYFIFLTILLVHRTFRDDVKCQKKYGRYWQQYCKKVPYKIVPYIF
ncbi:uncharacterized protein [Clytia hemisphaerica]|uniref:uncharacterized protein n=1 Tax=Clytia hemisphaerica TaxID=252671 RepID=UPI0034D672A1